MKLEFKPEDFECVLPADSMSIERIQISVAANAKLVNYIKEHGKEVFLENYPNQELPSRTWRETYCDFTPKHKAILINVEKIEPIQKEHKHEWVCSCGEKHV